MSCPKGHDRGELAERGLIGKATICSNWSDNDVREEITSIFKDVFLLQNAEQLPFIYLGIMPGTKKLDVVKTSRSFVWTGAEVIGNAGQGSLYILAGIPLPTDDSEDGLFAPLSKRSRQEPPDHGPREREEYGYEDSSDDWLMRDTFQRSPPSSPRRNVTNPCSSETQSRSFYSQYADWSCDPKLTMEEPAVGVEEQAPDNEAPGNSDMSLGDILAIHKAVIMEPFATEPDAVEEIKFLVRRKHIVEDTFRKLKRTDPEELIHLPRVTFLGEPAIDEGGPRREFFTSFFEAIQSSSLLEGSPREQIISHHIESLTKEHYKFLGYVIVLSLMNGGPGPYLFHKAIAEKIVFNKQKCALSLGDVGDYELREHLFKIQNMNNEQEFLDYVDKNVGRRHDIGYSKDLKLADKENLIDYLVKDYVLHSPGLYQLIEGLQVLDLLQVMRHYPQHFMKVLIRNERNLTAAILEDLLQPSFSEDGTNKRQTEESIFMNLSFFFQDVEAGKVTLKLEDSEEEVTIRLGDVLHFATGCKTIPPEGFINKLGIVFDHESGPHRKISANTCAEIICLPVNEKMKSQESLASEFVESIINGQGYGKV